METVGESIIAGLEEAIAYVQGDESRGRAHQVSVPEHVNVRAIRHRQGMTQQVFAQCYGFDVWAVRNWEQGRRQPEKSARILLTIIDREPEAARRALTWEERAPRGGAAPGMTAPGTQRQSRVGSRGSSRSRAGTARNTAAKSASPKSRAKGTAPTTRAQPHSRARRGGA
jgi:putative transcriptional regulator